jgi:hypothetical protein
MNDWDELNEDLRESNRQQTDHLFIKLRAIGCDAVAKEDPRPPVKEFTRDEIEMLERLEHRRWMNERLLAGWTAGEHSESLRKNPNLVPWEDLDDGTKKFDREAVNKIPALLEADGMKVCRRDRPGKRGA